ncbi:hypothetical protein GPA27_24980 [Aromatoleum toluolicum]|uniref:hypothetical protein n=1 Tax=Aromatoleum toluolicum TaxID=90060 RepID=UPI001FE3683B|nr:hypothetical protein [Aromatoleum toluolicum]NMG00640.2 hypothetical protein [Aromatoleum toluolicum]
MLNLDLRDGRAAYWLASAILFVFCVSFYTPISSKASNNVFYIGLGLPALAWWLSRPRAALGLFRVAPAFLAAYGALAAWLVIADPTFLRDTLYIAALFVCCAMLERHGSGVARAYTGFALVSMALFAFAILKWAQLAWVHHFWGRITLWGQGENPVYAGLLISSSLVFLWLFHVEPRLRDRSRPAYLVALLGLVALGGLCAVVFQARSALVGFAAFLVVLLIQRRLVVVGSLLAVVAAVALWDSGVADALLERGGSYRIEIWGDALRRLESECSLLVGCGKDDYRFLGQFFHPHSAYVSILYEAGAIGLALFLAMALAFFVAAWRSRSRWMLVALVGWAGVATTTPGVIVSPRTLWVFFWIPTLMAVLESGRPALEAYYRTRDEISRRG